MSASLRRRQALDQYAAGWAHKTCANSSRITDDVATPFFFEPYSTSPAGTATASNLSALPLPLPTGSVRDSEDDGQAAVARSHRLESIQSEIINRRLRHVQDRPPPHHELRLEY